MRHLQISTKVSSYIANFTLSYPVSSTPNNEPPLSFQLLGRNVFQGDTMPPINIWLDFNPLIQLIQSLQCPGFAFRIPLSYPEDLPSWASTTLVYGTNMILMNPVVGTNAKYLIIYLMDLLY